MGAIIVLTVLFLLIMIFSELRQITKQLEELNRWVSGKPDPPDDAATHAEGAAPPLE